MQHGLDECAYTFYEARCNCYSKQIDKMTLYSDRGQMTAKTNDCWKHEFLRQAAEIAIDE